MSELQGSFLGNKDGRSSLSQNRPQAGFGASNSLVSHGKFLNNGGGQTKSFAQEMAALANSGEELPEEIKSQLEQLNQDGSEGLDQNQLLGKANRQRNHLQQSGFSSGEELLNKAQADKESLRQEDVRKSFDSNRSKDNEERVSEEKRHYYSSNESTMASVAQENSKTITEAAREGNVGQQEQRQSEDGQRQQQLANWELLAPRLIEDSKNRAIRLDIPDVEDIQTIIVRAGDSGVDIQAVGSESMISGLASREGMLKAALSKKNVRLGSLKAFDAKALYK